MMRQFRQAQQWLKAFALAAAAILAPVQAIAQTAPPAPSVSLSEGYVLGPNDGIEVSIVGRDDYKARVQVQADGTIALPLIGAVTASNLTIIQLRDEVRRRLVAGGFFARPEVAVSLTSGVSRYVVVLGEVATPGVVNIDREYRLSEVIARAGGIRATGSDIVTVTTPAGQHGDYSLQAIATGAVPDPVVGPGTKVFVSPPKLFYIDGQVASPGGYPIDPGMTVRRALARGGGLTALGSRKSIKLYRGDQVRKASPDEKILPGDTIVVGERFF